MRPIIALVIGAVVAVILAYIACAVIENTELPDWLCLVSWLLAAVLWVIWAFPAYLRR